MPMERKEGEVCGRRWTAPKYDDFGKETRVPVTCDGIVKMERARTAEETDWGPKPAGLRCNKCGWGFDAKRPGKHEYQPDVHDEALEGLKTLRKRASKDMSMFHGSKLANGTAVNQLELLDILIKERESD